MNEINNNISHIVTNISLNNNKAEVKPAQVNETPERTVVPDTGVLGKSQVAKPDNIQSDIDFCLKQSPEFLEKCDKFFDNAFNSLMKINDEFAYEKACVLSKEFANEFS